MSNYEIFSLSALEIQLNRKHPSPLWKPSDALETGSVGHKKIPLPIKQIKTLHQFNCKL